MKMKKSDLKKLIREIIEGEMLGGKGDATDPKSVDQKELAVGMKVEREHTDSDEKAKEITIDHLTENPKYYSELVASGIVDEKEALDLAKKLGIGQNKIKESAIGDMYIELGESIEDLDRSLHKVKDICKKMRYTKAVPTLNKLKHDVLDLKKMFGDSYDFL